MRNDLVIEKMIQMIEKWNLCIKSFPCLGSSFKWCIWKIERMLICITGNQHSKRMWEVFGV